jgi:hypothetical protein
MAMFSVTIPPVFDKSDIRATLRGGCGHRLMIPLSNLIQRGLTIE